MRTQKVNLDFYLKIDDPGVFRDIMMSHLQCRSEGPNEKRQKCVIYSEGTLDPIFIQIWALKFR